MRCSRLSISSSISAIESSATLDVPGKSPATVCSSDSATDTGEGVLEQVLRREPGGGAEPPAVERAGVLDEVERSRRHVIEPEIEELPEDQARHGFGDRHGRAARLLDGHGERYGARPDPVEDLVRSALERDGDGFGDVLLVDELHHGVEANDSREEEREEVLSHRDRNVRA